MKKNHFDRSKKTNLKKEKNMPVKPLKTQKEIVEEYEKYYISYNRCFENGFKKLRQRKPVLAAKIYNAVTTRKNNDSYILNSLKNDVFIANKRYSIILNRYNRLIKLLSKSDEIIENMNEKINKKEDIECLT